MKRLYIELIITALYTLVLLPGLTFGCYHYRELPIVHSWWFLLICAAVCLIPGILIPLKMNFDKGLLVLWYVALAAFLIIGITDLQTMELLA